MLATAVSRLRWAASDLALVVIGSAVLLAAFGLPAGLAYGLSTGNVGYELPRVLVATLTYLPAVWVVAGIAMALYGLVPRLSFVSWGALGAFGTSRADRRDVAGEPVGIEHLAIQPRAEGSRQWGVRDAPGFAHPLGVGARHRWTRRIPASQHRLTEGSWCLLDHR